MKRKVPVYFHPRQLEHKPLYEWAFGDKLEHPETTTRAANILAALESEPQSFEVRTPSPSSPSELTRLHDARMIALYRAATRLEPDKTFYPSVFPKRRETEPDPTDIKQAGYFCFDSGTPLTHMTWEAAAWSATCALSAAEAVRGGAHLAYALSRPPGHHASRDLFGGYCYLNNAALAAETMGGRTVILDIDFHHGNGTQELYWSSPEVLFISIHGDPREFYPYFSGWATERGGGAAVGSTINLPLPKGTDGAEYFRVLARDVIPEIIAFAPQSLILSAGFDTYELDPIGAFALKTPDFTELGERLGRLKLPTVVVQEGGYCTEALGHNVAALLHGLQSAIR